MENYETLNPLNDNSWRSSWNTIIYRIISDDFELAKTFNNFFENAVANPDIKMNSPEVNSTNPHNLDIA